MNKKIFALLLTITIFTLSAAFTAEKEWENKDYQTLETMLLKIQKTDKNKALELSSFMMKKFPDKTIPYTTAVSIYTMKKQNDKAAEILQSAIKSITPNDALYLRLANLYKRTNPEKLTLFIEDFKKSQTAREDYIILLSKFYIIQGNEKEAVSNLKEYIAKNKPKASTVKLLFSLLKETNSGEAWKIAASYITGKEFTYEQRLELFNSIIDPQFKKSDKDMEQIIDISINIIEDNKEYPKAREIAKNTMNSIIGNEHEKKCEAYIKSKINLQKTGELYNWLYIQYIAAAGDQDKLAKAFAEYKGEHPFILEDKARKFGEFKELASEARATWEKLMKILPDDNRIVLSYAQYLNHSEKQKDSQAVLEKISPDKLNKDLLFLYFALAFNNLCKEKDMKDVVNYWEKAGKLMNYQHLGVYKDGIFQSLPETAQHKEIMKYVEDKIKDKSPQTEPLLYLKIYTAEALRDSDLYFKTAEEFLSSMKELNDETAYLLVKEAIRLGLKITEDEKTKSEKIDILNENYLNFAQKWLETLIKRNALIPDYYTDLIVIYKAKGKEKEAADMIAGTIKGNENDSDKLNMAGYALAKAGNPALALSYYEKAIKIRSDEIRYLINYAGCLIRLEKYEDASKVYLDILNGKHSEKSYNLSFLLKQIWICKNALKKQDDFYKLIEDLKKNPVINKEELILKTAEILSEEKVYAPAESLLKDYIKDNEATKDVFGIYFQLAVMYADMSKYDEAIAIFDKCLSTYGKDPTRAVDCLYNKGEMLRRKGSYDECVKLWSAIHEKYPDDQDAQTAIIAAAIVADETLKDTDKAIKLIEKYLSLNPKDQNGIQTAKAKLFEFKQKKGK